MRLRRYMADFWEIIVKSVDPAARLPKPEIQKNTLHAAGDRVLRFVQLTGKKFWEIYTKISEEKCGCDRIRLPVESNETAAGTTPKTAFLP